MQRMQLIICLGEYSTYVFLGPLNVNQKEMMLSVRYITVQIMCSDSSLPMLIEQIMTFEMKKTSIAQLRYYKPGENNLI